ncbi:GNAT family N-acetyltransferase [Roseateles sp. DB2]|uniref:GNAT family N-acetyltransferase n=1 Tax=Roseateles sp. DB2 TaxID=3453717 RepID=UPI003EEB0E0A
MGLQNFLADQDLNVQALGEADAPRLQSLFEACADYFHRCGLVLAADEARQELRSAPPPDFAWAAQWHLGITQPGGEGLLACLHVCSEAPAAGAWHLGLLMVHPARRGTGLAQRLLAALESWARQSGARWMRLGVVAGNEPAERFWRSQGYRELRSRVSQAAGQPPGPVRVMLKHLGDGPALADWADYLAAVPRDRQPQDSLRLVADALPLRSREGRVQLRRMRESDLDRFHAYRSDAETARFQGWTQAQDPAQSAVFLREMSEAAIGVPDEWVQLAIADGEDDQLIGDIGLCLRARPPELTPGADTHPLGAWMGITLHPGWRGRGLGREAFVALQDFLLDAGGLLEVECWVDARNQPSIQLLEASGMRRFCTEVRDFRGAPCEEHGYQRWRGLW